MNSANAAIGTNRSVSLFGMILLVEIKDDITPENSETSAKRMAKPSLPPFLIRSF